MSNVVALRLPDAELIALALRQFGYVDPDEIMELPPLRRLPSRLTVLGVAAGARSPARQTKGGMDEP